MTHNPAKSSWPLLKISVPPNKESSKKEVQNATEDIQVFTDGSVIDGKVGPAAVLTRQGKDHQILHLHLGRADSFNNYEAELAGLLLGMHLIKTEKATRRHTAIGTDNQAVISTVQKELSTPSHYMAAEVICSVKLLNRQRKSNNYSLTLRWTAGHVGIDGNELIDIEAKVAAKGKSSTPKLLPHIFRQKLKVSAMALKQGHNKRTVEKWKKTWKSTPRGKRDHQIDSSSPLENFLRLISNPKLPHQVSSLISQMCIAHIPLNSYLHKFKWVDNPRCPACRERDETVEHYLLLCPGYAHEHWAMEEHLKRKPDLRTLLRDPKATLMLKNYIEATHRFGPQANQSR